MPTNTAPLTLTPRGRCNLAQQLGPNYSVNNGNIIGPPEGRYRISDEKALTALLLKEGKENTKEKRRGRIEELCK